MANRKAILVRQCKTPSGWRRYPVAKSKNGRERPNFVVVKGVQVEYPEGYYQVRTYEGSKMVYRTVGDNLAKAVFERDKESRLLTAKEAATDAGIQIVQDEARKNLKDASKAWIESVLARGSYEAAELYERTATGFLLVCRKQYADEITNDDILAYHRQQREAGYADRTVANRHGHLRSFLIYLKFDREKIKDVMGKKPRYEKTLPEIYEPSEIKAFFSSLQEEYDYLLFYVLLTTGLREREVAHLEWPDLHWKRKVLKVTSKTHWGFRIKDHEEREMPLNSKLVIRLEKFRKAHPTSKLVFGRLGGEIDAPEGHLLRRLKSKAKDAGLNCGHCEGCTQSGECERWFLHKFRATYITKLLREGLDLRTVMTLSGHADIESVMRYLRPAEGKEVQDKVNAINWGGE